MTFALCSFEDAPVIEISEEEYLDLCRSKTQFSRVTRIEENFDAVMEDYVEFEQTMFHFGMRHLAFPILDHIDFHSMRNVINRRILHVLSTARLYRDALKRHGKSLLKNTRSSTEFDALLSDSPSHPMSYRIVEALRNYSQHNEFPLASMGTSSSLDIEKGKAFDEATVAKARSSHSIIASIDAQKIAKERHLAPDVRNALQELGNKVEIVDHLRVYIEHLGNIHSTFRKLVNSNEQHWEKTIRNALARFYALSSRAKSPVVYAAKLDRGKRVEQIQLFQEFFDVHKALRRKNLVSRNLSKSYVKWPGQYD